MKRLCIIILSVIALCVKAQVPIIGSLTQEDGLQDNSISYIFQDSRQLMYFGSYKGLDRYDGAKITNIPFASGNEKETDIIIGIVEDADGNLYVGNNHGLWKLDNKKLKLKRVFEKEIDCPVYGLVKERNDIFVSSKYGNWKISDGKISKTSKVIKKAETPLAKGFSYGNWGRFENANAGYVSPDGVRWVGYKFFGVDYTYYNRGIFKTFAQDDFNSLNMQIRSFLKDGNRMLLGTRKGLYVVSTNGSKYIDSETLGANVVTQIVAAPGSHSYLVATIGDGVKKLDASSLQVTGTLMPYANVYQIIKDKEGNLWFCSSRGLGRYNPKNNQFKVFNSRNSQLPSDEVFCIGFDNRGNGWISTTEGTCQYLSKGQYIVSNTTTKKVKDLGPLRDIYNYSRNNLLLIPQHGRAVVYNIVSDNVHTLNLETDTEEPSLLYVKNLGKDKWLYVTSDGIFYSNKGQMRKFGYIDGLPNMQFQSHAITIDYNGITVSHNGITADSNGIIWAATNGGLVYARLTDIINHHYSHHDIVLDEIQTDHWYSDVETNKVLMSKQLRLTRLRNDLTVRISPVIYGNTRSMAFRYRLENSNDTTWKVAGHERIISFRDLAAGNYILRIEAVGMPEISTEIKVIVPFTYQAIVMFIIIVLAFLFAGYIAYCKKTKTEYFWKRFIPKPEKYQRSHIDSAEAKKLQKAVIKYLDEKKPYLNPDFQMSDLAKALDCSTHELSQVFSQYLQRNYYDLIAEYRINEFKRLAADPKYSKFTITALSEQCGFRSRTPFLTAFKKFTGLTPKEYMKNKK